MIPTQILRAASRVVSPWRNGGGETAEIARHPRAATQNWWWRVSIATIAIDGDFSPFPGCDRILMPLDGDVHLDVEGARQNVPTLGTVRFGGERAVRAVDVARPTVDLNVIVSRSWGWAETEIVASPDSGLAPRPRQTVLVMALSDGVLTSAGALASLDTAVVEAGGEIVIDQGSVVAIRLNEYSSCWASRPFPWPP